MKYNTLASLSEKIASKDSKLTFLTELDVFKHKSKQYNNQLWTLNDFPEVNVTCSQAVSLTSFCG